MRTIAVVTSSRADYSHLYWPLRALKKHAEVSLKLIVVGAHLSPSLISPPSMWAIGIRSASATEAGASIS